MKKYIKRLITKFIRFLNHYIDIREMLLTSRRYRSETSKFRHLFIDYCKGNGIDIGYGGDPISPSAITIDLEKPYAQTGGYLLNLAGDARKLHWFNDRCLDYVYSSHLLEDFEEKEMIVREWVRVLKDGGFIILLLPDEQRYRKHCRKNGLQRNPNHKDIEFCLDNIKKILISLNIMIVAEFPKLIDKKEDSDYNFAVVAKK